MGVPSAGDAPGGSRGTLPVYHRMEIRAIRESGGGGSAGSRRRRPREGDCTAGRRI